MDERVVVVFHLGALAHYKVCRSEKESYTAKLVKYAGIQSKFPPDQFDLHKVGRHWEDDGLDQELINEIGKAIELAQRQD